MLDADIKRKVLKIVVLGDSTVGKTSIINAYLNMEFNQDMLSNICSEKFTKKMKMDDGNEMKILIWDTAGQERFRSIATSTIKNAQGIVLVFDLTQKDTFDNLGRWIEEIKNNSNKTTVLLGNKCDLLDNIVVTDNEAKNFAHSNQMEYYSTSAKENININEVFNYICKKAYEQNKDTIGMGLDRDKKIKYEKKRKCC